MGGSASLFDKRILIVDDEESIRDILKTALEKEGFARVSEAASGREALEICLKEKPDLVILDIMLPDLDGFEVCKKLREHTMVPILFLSAKGEEVDKILGLGIGGDDYITKPFSPKEVAFRVKAHLRREQYYSKVKAENDEASQQVLLFGDIRIDPEKGEVLKGGQPGV